LDEVLEKIGLEEITSVFEIDVDEKGVEFEFPSWRLVGDEDSHLSLVPDI
jgi:hypothetical protein